MTEVILLLTKCSLQQNINIIRREKRDETDNHNIDRDITNRKKQILEREKERERGEEGIKSPNNETANIDLLGGSFRIIPHVDTMNIL